MIINVTVFLPFSDIQQQPKDPELRDGNYLLVACDCLFINGHLLQLGAYLPFSGKSWIKNIKPDIFTDVIDDDLRPTYIGAYTKVSWLDWNRNKLPM